MDDEARALLIKSRALLVESLALIHSLHADNAALLRTIEKLNYIIGLIAEMASHLKDPTALELIQDILHPEERTGP